MAFTSKDGSRHSNHSTMKQADARFGSKQPAAPAPGGDEMDGIDPMAGGEQDGAALAEQHGPAVEIQVHHDHQAGKHSVHGSHPDGHEHDSEHGSAEEAHRFAGELAGVGGGSSDMGNTGGMDGGM